MVIPHQSNITEVSPRVDIFALGATLHHILSRQDPRSSPSFSFQQRPISSVYPAVSQELEEVIYKALAYKSEDRYQTAEEMKHALIQVRSSVKKNS